MNEANNVGLFLLNLGDRSVWGQEQMENSEGSDFGKIRANVFSFAYVI